jgi:hypothetical protein
MTTSLTDPAHSALKSLARIYPVVDDGNPIRVRAALRADGTSGTGTAALIAELATLRTVREPLMSSQLMSTPP